MLLDHPHFPVSVLKVLLEQQSQIWTRGIPAADARRLPDATLRACEAQVEFVVLISNQFGIEQAYLREHLAAIHATEHRIRRSFIVGVVPTRSTDGKRAVVRGGNRPLHTSVALADKRAADVVRTSLFQ